MQGVGFWFSIIEMIEKDWKTCYYLEEHVFFF